MNKNTIEIIKKNKRNQSFRKKLKGNQGFTLVEMILAVGILALLSILVLQLFLTSTNMSQKAYDLDQAVLASKSAVENFKNHPTPSSRDVMTYYDKDWKQIIPSDNKKPENSEFIVVLSIQKETSTTNNQLSQKNNSIQDNAGMNSSINNSQGLYKLKATVTKISSYLHESKSNIPLYTLEAMKYVPGGVK